MLTALAVLLFSHLDYAWWWYLVFFLAPDLAMPGYLFGPRAGAWCYNFTHHRGVAVALYIVGTFTSSPELMFAGTVVLGHSSFDRVLGYGLKHEDSFGHTHLGWIGKQSASG